MLRPEDFFDLDGFEFRGVFDGCEHVWEALLAVGRFALEYITSVDSDDLIRGTVMNGAHIDDRDAVVIGEGTVVEPGAFIMGPAIIGRNCQIRHGCYIRGDVIVGNDCIVGHASELKNCIMLDTAQCPHFAYVGDSILGRNVNLGAGTKLSNVPVLSTRDPKTGKRPTVKLTIGGTEYDTGLPKFGAVLGDGCQTGCNVV
ncbi:MAG: glucose-1-phosphate thymidylyltransferase, partial [Armatimonadota bacterium]